MEKMLYTIEELGEATGITPRTIRYYTTEGLLPPPETRGRYALYADEHLLRLRLIVRLKEAFLPLGAIKNRVEHLTFDEVVELLKGVEAYEQGGPEAAPQLSLAEIGTGGETHRDFVGRVLANRIALNSIRRTSPSKGEEGEVEEIVETKKAKDSGPGEGWRRIALMNGVELHVQEAVLPKAQTFLESAERGTPL